MLPLIVATAAAYFIIDQQPAIGLLVALLSLYFAPTLIAASRRHHQTMAIAVLNAFTGFTAIGWVAALVWSATAKREETV